MNYTHLFIAFFLIISFSNCKKEPKNKSINVTIESTDEKIEDTCIFDQKTQTDDFLKDIPELQNYSWDPNEKKASIILNNLETISIYRGGCDHFSLETTLIINKKITFSDTFVLQKIKWLLETYNLEYDSQTLIKCIKQNCVNFTKEDMNNYYANFMNELIYESYTIRYKTVNNKTYISLDYYIN